MDKNKNKLFNSNIEKLKYTINYSINETPRYRPLVGMDEVFDELPSTNDNTNEFEQGNKPPQGDNKQEQPPVNPGEQQPVNNPENQTVVPPSPTPAFDNSPETNNSMQPGGDGMGVEPNVNVIQNDIIKDNIETMKSIHSKIDMLDSMVQNINQTLTKISTDVEEVREPTDGEKFMNKKYVSYPYSYQLSDLWNDNWFNKKRQEEVELENGIRKLEDGSYIADLDDLPQYSKQDIKNSFNTLNEDEKKKSTNIQKKIGEDVINVFLNYCNDNLKLNGELPELTIINDNSFSDEHKSFGGYIPEDKKIFLVVTRRILADTLRTLAHELVHHKQNLEGRIKEDSGKTGSEEENEANSKAGVLLRDFGKLQPIIYTHTYEDLQ
jgi:hypothetical protein